MKTVDVYAALPKELIHSITAPRRGEPPKVTVAEVRAILSSPDPRPVQAVLEGSLIIHSSMLYPNGDTISVYIVVASDGLYLTEAGTTFYNFSVAGLSCTQRLVDFCNGICANIGIDLNGAKEGPAFYPSSIGVRSTRANFLGDFLRVVEGIAKASTIGYFKEEFSHDRKREDS